MLAWCTRRGSPSIPFGGGTSVVGGVEPRRRRRLRGVVSLDLRRLDRVLEVDERSRAARSQAGVLGPPLEEQLRRTASRSATSRSRSSSRRWAAGSRRAPAATTRRCPRTSTSSSRRDVVTPRGSLETRRLPGSGAGPGPARLLLGSEGTLGVITEAWMRAAGAAALARVGGPCGSRASRTPSRRRARSRSPASSRRTAACSTATRPLLSRRGDGTRRVLVVGFESADRPGRTRELARDAAELLPRPHGTDRRSGTAHARPAAWRKAFFDAPYLRRARAHRLLSDTFETACTWDQFPALHAGAHAARRGRAPTRRAAAGSSRAASRTSIPTARRRTTRSSAPARPGAELEQWAAIKAAASEALLGRGGTITHHHAVGRYHRPWYDRERRRCSRRAARREARARSARHPESRRADRRPRGGEMTRARLLAVAGAVALVVTAALLRNSLGTDGPRTFTGVPVTDPGPIHVHGLGVNPADGALFIATHTGLFRAGPGDERARRVGEREQDTMGFTVIGKNRFLGSGHPDGREDLPPFLGLIESCDAGGSGRPLAAGGGRLSRAPLSSARHVYGYERLQRPAARQAPTAAGRGRSWIRPGPTADLGAASRAIPSGASSRRPQARVCSRRANGRRELERGSDEAVGLLAWPRREAAVSRRRRGHGARQQRRRPQARRAARWVGSRRRCLQSERTSCTSRCTTARSSGSTIGGAAWTIRSRP